MRETIQEKVVSVQRANSQELGRMQRLLIVWEEWDRSRKLYEGHYIDT